VKVKWRFKEHGVDTFTPYPREINALLEKAYQEKAGCYTGKRLGFVFMVDFGQMNEQRQNSNGFFEVSRIQNRECHDRVTSLSQVRVIAISFTVPDFWEAMEGKKTLCYDLTPSSEEFKCVEKNFRSTASAFNQIVKVFR
jgi:hypothetical protein